MSNSKIGIIYRKNVVRDSRGQVIKESENWHMGFKTYADYQEWLAKQKNIRIILEEKYE